jgi:hypothetical protein
MASETQTSVFIIHSSEDKLLVKKINPELTKRRLKCVVDHKDFTPGQTIVNNMANSVQGSTKTLMVVSQAALESNFVTFELILALEKSQRTNRLVVVMLLVDVEEDDPRLTNNAFMEVIPKIKMPTDTDADSSWLDKLAELLTSKIYVRLIWI